MELITALIIVVFIAIAGFTIKMLHLSREEVKENKEYVASLRPISLSFSPLTIDEMTVLQRKCRVFGYYLLYGVKRDGSYVVYVSKSKKAILVGGILKDIENEAYNCMYAHQEDCLAKTTEKYLLKDILK